MLEIFSKLLIEENIYSLRNSILKEYFYFLVTLMVKCLPKMRETWVQSLGGEDLLEKEMAIHSNILAWKIPRMEESGRLQSMGSQGVGHG